MQFQESSFKIPVHFCAVFQVPRQTIHTHNYSYVYVVYSIPSNTFLFQEFFQWYVCSPEDHIEYLCSDCVKMHKRLRATKNHVISPLENNDCNME